MTLSDQASSTGPQLASDDPGAADPRPDATRDDLAQVRERIRAAQRRLAKHLDELRLPRHGWPEVFRYDPVRTKNLEKAVNYLHRLLLFLGDSGREDRHVDLSSLDALLDRLEKVERISAHCAWELADSLSLELIRRGDDAYIYVLLTGTDLPIGRDWTKRFPPDVVKSVLDAFGAPGDAHGRRMARHVLEEVIQAQVQEYRYDRARAELRGIYLGRMVLVLLVTLLPFAWFFLHVASPSARPSQPPPDLSRELVLMVLFAGAVGSTLSRAIKLGGQRVEDAGAPLGIRALYSGWKVFLAQPVIGAASAFLVFLVLRSKLLVLGTATTDDPAVPGLVAFLAGFSEPFFIGTLDRIAGQGGRKT